MQRDENIDSESESTGIYMILNTVTGKAYIGQADNIRARLIFHRARLRKGTHKNPYLQASFNKHGEQIFTFKTVHVCTTFEDLLRITDIEQIWVDAFKVNNKCYNMLEPMKSRLGTKQSDAAKAKLSKANKGRVITWGDKISEAKRGIPQSQEHRAKLSAVRMGKVSSNAASVYVVNSQGSVISFRSERVFSLAIGRVAGYAYAMRQRDHTHQSMYDHAVAQGLVIP